MDNDNSKRKEKLKSIFEYGYKINIIVKTITIFF